MKFGLCNITKELLWSMCDLANPIYVCAGVPPLLCCDVCELNQSIVHLLVVDQNYNFLSVCYQQNESIPQQIEFSVKDKHDKLISSANCYYYYYYFFGCKCRWVEYGIIVDAPRLGKLLLFIRIDLSARLSRCKIKLFILVCLYFPSIVMIF